MLFTCDPDSGAPYYVINVDRGSSRTDVVTSGRAGSIEKVVVWRRRRESVSDPLASRLLDAAAELEPLLFNAALDIEFALDSSDRLFILQVRPLTTAGARGLALASQDLDEEVREIQGYVRGLMRPKPGLAGETTALGIMPDWNPAEMIGVVPRPLALSLYQALIGDRAWSEARAKMGYRDVAPEPLILSLAGGPTSTCGRASIPSCRRRFPARSRRSSCAPSSPHCSPDPNCTTRSSSGWLSPAWRWTSIHRRAPGPGGAVRIRARAAELAPAGADGLAAAAGGALSRSSWARRGGWHPSRRDPGRAAADQASLGWAVYVLSEDCKRFGTLPFSILARQAFVSVAFLRALVHRGVLRSTNTNSCSPGSTVGGELTRDLAAHTRGELSREQFLAAYGHLRPSTYELTSPVTGIRRISTSGAERHSGPARRQRARPRRKRAARPPRPGDRRVAGSGGLHCQASQLRDFILGSIPAREAAKFEFTKNVSAVLELVASFAGSFGFDRSDASFLTLERVARCARDSPSIAMRTELARDIEFAKKRWSLAAAIQVPPLIGCEADVESFVIREATPNFVTRKRVTAPVTRVETGRGRPQLEGRIVLIESADPGYDWIFAQSIAGLVTRHGGVASHMAIRAAEFGLPAAIGCGELLFERACLAQVLELDCESQQLRVVR